MVVDALEVAGEEGFRRYRVVFLFES